jgi:hypothetical protein
MSHSKWMIALLATSFAAALSHAEPTRSLFTPENKFPRWGQLEAGANYFFTEETDDDNFVDTDTTVVAPYLRYGLAKELALRVDVPFVSTDPSVGDGESGLGDVDVTLELRAYEDIFEYPFIIPHVTVSVPTGDEDKGLGEGNTVITPGLAVGTVTYDTMTWILDASYRINADSENQLILSGSFIYDVSDILAFLLEVRFEDEANGPNTDAEFLVLGGMTYDWSERFQTAFHVGTAAEGNTDVITAVRASYSF